MRRACLIVALFAIACGTAKPIGPLEGTYAIVFDGSFVTPVTLERASFPSTDVEAAIRQLFDERTDRFTWSDRELLDPGLFDAVVVLRITRLPGAATHSTATAG